MPRGRTGRSWIGFSHCPVEHISAMLPGPPIHRCCNECGRVFSQPTCSSTNTYGAVLWSDAKVEAPMEPVIPDLVKCPHCSALLWLDEAPLAAPGERKRRRLRYVLPTEDDLFHALDPSVASTADKLRYVRTELWWAANDVHRRGGPGANAGFSDRHGHNVVALFGMLSTGVERERIMKAEIARELGWFSEASDLLAAKFDDSLAPVVARLRALVADRVQSVARLTLNAA